MVNQYMTPEEAEAASPYAGNTGVIGQTAAEADAANVVGRRNREAVGLGSGYGGYTEEQLDAVNQQRAQEQQDQREQDRLNYEQRARINAGLRPGYTDESELGDTTTQNFRKMNRMLALSGMPTVSDDAFTGFVLGSQYKMAVSTPGTRDDQFFLNEIGKWNRNPIELSSAYHDVGIKAAVPIPANPFENRGDVALALEKGGNLKDFQPDRYGFNPNVGSMIGTLPGGKGIQETQWEIAKTGRAANVDFQPAIEYQVSQKGRYGPYGYLAGGIPDKVEVSAPRDTPKIDPILPPTPTLKTGTPMSKDWNPFVVSAAEPIGYISEGVQIPNTTQELPTTGAKKFVLVPATTSKWVEGLLGSSMDFVTGIVGWTPFKDSMQTVDPQLSTWRIENEEMKVNATPKEYNAFLQKSFEEGTLTKPVTSPTFVENPRLVYDYGEFSKWGAGAGDQVRNKLGFTQEQLDVAQYNIEQKKGVETIPEKLVFGTGYTFSTKPEKIITAYGGGVIMVAGGEVIGLGAGATGITARLAATAAAHPTAAAITTNVVRYGVPITLGALTYYGASEQFTATPERTTVNLGKMFPEFTAVMWGGGSAYAGARAIERYGLPAIGPFIAGQGKKVILPGWEDSAKIEFTTKRETLLGDRGITTDAQGKPIVSVVGQEPISAPTVREIGQGMILPRTNELSLPQGTPLPLSKEALVWKDAGIISRPDMRNLGEVLYRPELSKGYTYTGSKTFTTENFGISPPDVPPVPTDLMPGTQIAAGRSAEILPAQTNVWADMLKLRIEPIVDRTPSGISMPSGVSQKYVNPEIRASTRAGVTVESVDTLMKNQMQYSIFERTAKEQRVADIIPRNIEQKPTALGNIEEILKSIQESEKRVPSTAPIWKPRSEIAPDTTTSVDYNNAMWKIWRMDKGTQAIPWDVANVETAGKTVGAVEKPTPISIIDNRIAPIPKPDSGVKPIQSTEKVQRQLQDDVWAPYYPQIPRTISRAPEPPRPPVTTKQVPEKPYVPPINIPEKPIPDRPWVPPITTPDKPIPPKIPGIPLFPVLPSLPGGSGSYGKKRKGRRFTEIFPFGIDISTMSFEGIKRPKGPAKKGRIIPKSMLTPVRRKKK